MGTHTAASTSATRLQAAGGFKFGGFGKKAATPTPTPTKKAAGGFKFGGPSKKAATPIEAASEGSKGIVRGFSKAWNPTVIKSDEGKIKRGFSKAWTPR